MRASSGRSLVALALALAGASACGDGTTTAPLEPTAGPAFDLFTVELPPDPDFLSPAEAAASPNPYFPLVPGTVWMYEADTEDGLEETTDAVTGDTRSIAGVEATVVRDAVYLAGDLIELTFDWYAQDTDGNVWYLGEAACEWEPGEYVEGSELEEDCGPTGEPAGSWEAGVDGAEAGIIMWADPLRYRGRTYRQEYYEDEAEDLAKILRGDRTVTVPAGTFAACIESMDWSPLEPGAREHKFYCPGYGLVLEVQPRGGRVRNELVDYEGLPVGMPAP